MNRLTRIPAISLILGPVLLAAASVAWLADAAELRGILSFWAILVTGIGLHGVVLPRLEQASPGARVGLAALLTVGIAAGAAFATEIAYADVFDVERLVEQDTPSAVLILAIPGLCFPLAAILTGVASLRHATLGRAAGWLLIAAGILFPASRIGDIAGLGLVDDLLWIAALAPVGWAALRAGQGSPAIATTG